jgi:hypothetical protein
MIVIYKQSFNVRRENYEALAVNVIQIHVHGITWLSDRHISPTYYCIFYKKFVIDKKAHLGMSLFLGLEFLFALAIT